MSIRKHVLMSHFVQPRVQTSANAGHGRSTQSYQRTRVLSALIYQALPEQKRTYYNVARLCWPAQLMCWVPYQVPVSCLQSCSTLDRWHLAPGMLTALLSVYTASFVAVPRSCCQR